MRRLKHGILAIILSLLVIFPSTPETSQIRLRSIADIGGEVENPISASRMPGGDASLPNPSWAMAGVDGGIPTGWANCDNTACNDLAPGGSGTVSATTIQTALGGAQVGGVSCSSSLPCVVRIRAGSFSIGGFTFDEDYRILRGAGANSTTLNFTSTTAGGCGLGDGSSVRWCSGSHSIACQSWCGGSASIDQTATWSSGYAQGTTTIVLSSVTALTVGSIIHLDQLDDASDGWPATGDMYVCNDDFPCSAQGFGSGYGHRDGNGRPAGQGRVHVEVHEVVSCGTSTPGAACNSTTVVIEPPIHAPNFRSGQTPQAWWDNRGDLIEWSGIEDMTMNFTSSGSVPGIINVGGKNVWVKGMRLLKNATGSNIMLIQAIMAYRMTTQQNYFYGPTASGTTQYVYTPQGAGSMLLENNIFHFNSSMIVSNDPESGSVHAFNYAHAGYYSQPAQPHNSGDLYNLYEGNDFSGFHGEEIHGTHHFITLFRNYFNRLQHASHAEAALSGITLWARNRFYNIVGNVIGHSSFGNYETQDTDDSNAIFQLDYNGNCTGCEDIAIDNNVSRTLLRWGNWDSINSATRFESSEVPSGITNFPNPVPSSQDLPDSLVYAEKPSWFGSVEWPPIGPDVTNPSPIADSGAHAYKIPARLCFEAASADPTYSAGSNPDILMGVGSNCPTP